MAAVIIAAAVVGLILYLNGSQGSGGGFSAFKTNFQSAPRVGIFAAAYNGTALSSTVGCATGIIEAIVGSHTNHRNATTIDFYIVNQTSCTFLKGGLGTRSNNYTTVALADCTPTISKEPTIYINYSLTNTTVIKQNYLYLSGNQQFLSECGIAQQLG